MIADWLLTDLTLLSWPLASFSLGWLVYSSPTGLMHREVSEAHRCIRMVNSLWRKSVTAVKTCYLSTLVSIE